MIFIEKIVNFFKKTTSEDSFIEDSKYFIEEKPLEHWIREISYLTAEADNFSKPPEHYWIETEKKLKDYR